jgi:hypothetical protein
VIPVVSAEPDTWPRWALGQQRVLLPGKLLSLAGVEAPRLVDKPGQAFVVELRQPGTAA